MQKLDRATLCALIVPLMSALAGCRLNGVESAERCVAGTCASAQSANAGTAPDGKSGEARPDENGASEGGDSNAKTGSDPGSKDPNGSDPGPTPTPKPGNVGIIPTDHLVFVSRATFTGKMGGLAGADTLCKSAATAAGYGGAWKAILSDETTNAKARLTFTKPIKNTKGTLIANNATELWSGAIANPILFDEKGVEVPRDNFDFFAWSGTYENGTYGISWFIAIVNNQNTRIKFACNNWTADTAAFSGNSGYFYSKTAAWIAAQPIFYEMHQCDRKKHLYCVSQ